MSSGCLVMVNGRILWDVNDRYSAIDHALFCSVYCFLSFFRAFS